MGAFLLVRKEKGLDAEEVERLYGNSRSVFDKKGLSLNKRIVTNEFVIWVFHKHRFQVDNVILFDNDQFIISTGTLIYNGESGADALRELYQDFSEKGEFLSNLSGHYCLVISKKGKLYLLNDWAGLYHVYSNKSKSVISSSFLAVLKALKAKNVSIQEFYEYVFNGTAYGEQTLIKEIDLIDSEAIWQLSPVLSAIPKRLDARRLDSTSSFHEMVEEVASNLFDYFGVLKANFGNSICSALTGGHDTRLLLALMRKVGIKPSYLYVYNDSRQPTCVPVARSIAEGEGLVIEYEDNNKFLRVEEGEFAEQLEKQYYIYDGLGHEGGVFDSGWGLYARLKRTEKARLHLNGGCGEIFRDFWRLPDKPLHVSQFVKSRYDFIDYSTCSDRFDRSSYFSTLANKIKFLLKTDQSRLSRRQIAMLFPLWRGKYWMGSNNSINNQLTYALTPLVEPRFAFQSFDIPLRYKNFGIFEAALIKFIDPALARYPSHYGHNFYDGISLPMKMQDSVKLYIPIWLRTYVKKHLWSVADRRFTLRGNKRQLPFYLRQNYLHRIFPSNQLNVSEYIDVNKISNPGILSRILSAELLITDRF